MRWFKHLSNASSDCLIAEIEDHSGLVGYARYWKLVEAIAGSMDRGKEPRLQLPWSAWKKLLRGEEEELRDLLKFLRRRGKIVLKERAGILEVAYPNITKYRDEYATRHTNGDTSKKRKGQENPDVVPIPSGQSPDNLTARDRERAKRKSDSKADGESATEAGGGREQRPPRSTVRELQGIRRKNLDPPAWEETPLGRERFQVSARVCFCAQRRDRRKPQSRMARVPA